MAEKTAMLQISVKASTITGAVIGFLWGLFSALSGTLFRPSFYGRGFNYTNVTGYPMTHAYAGLGWLAVVVGIVGGAIIGVIIAFVYNWAAKMR